MAYAPTVNNTSGQILAAGITAGADNIAGILDSLAKRREESRSADDTMELLMHVSPDTIPKGQDGQVDAAFLEKFYASPLKAKQQTIGLLTSQIITAQDRAQMGLINAQTGQVKANTGLIGAQAGQYRAATQAAAQGATARQQNQANAGKWDGYRNTARQSKRVPGGAIPGMQGPVDPDLPVGPPEFRVSPPPLF